MRHYQRNGRTIPCDQCGKPVYRMQSKIKPHNFCSRECSDEWKRRDRRVLACDTCGAELIRAECFIRPTGNYCSRRCFGVGNGKRQGSPQETMQCEWCGAIYRGYPDRKYCGYECANEALAEARVEHLSEVRSKASHPSRLDPDAISHHPQWPRWCNVKTRCCYPSSPSYKYYGGRGIGIHKPWLEDPALFLQYLDEVLGACPPGYSLDRIDVDGHYEPGNLRWASATTQANNKSASVEFRGERVDPDSRFGCSLCPETFTSESGFTRHLRDHRRAAV